MIPLFRMWLGNEIYLRSTPCFRSLRETNSSPMSCPKYGTGTGPARWEKLRVQSDQSVA